MKECYCAEGRCQVRQGAIPLGGGYFCKIPTIKVLPVNRNSSCTPITDDTKPFKATI